jgi:hypothetical protein
VSPEKVEALSPETAGGGASAIFGLRNGNEEAAPLTFDSFVP